jgi:predicted MPP superfamily phosphohydrolase
VTVERYKGVLCIADPHLAQRAIGRRVDDYTSAILDKLSFCLTYAAREDLLAAFLGDVFHAADEDADWLLDELEAMLEPAGAVCIFGNHDCSGETLDEGDALARLLARGRLTLLDGDRPWRGELGGRPAAVGGSAWGRPVPRAFDRKPDGTSPPAELVLWLAHADLLVPGRGDGIEFRALRGIDLVVNGHVHSRLPTAKTGATTWCNPGSISRYSGSSTARSREPAALRVDAGREGFELSWITVPHRPADEVFADPRHGDR